MIPKVIHYCWFGDHPLPPSARRCIDSWKKHCPDYEIREWNEHTIDIASHPYMREAYEEKAWGFVPDVARLQIIYQYGGIYLDTDVEMIRPFDSLLRCRGFMGLEDGNHVALGLGFGAEARHPLIKQLLDDYDGRHFRNPDGTLNRQSAPSLQAPVWERNGFKRENTLQTVCRTVIYPSDFFSPLSYQTGKLRITDNTYSIHHYEGSWLTPEEREYFLLRRALLQKYKLLAKPAWKCVRIRRHLQQAGLIKTIDLAIQKAKGRLLP